MIRYEAGKWGIRFAFSLEGSVFPRAFVFALPCGVLATVLYFVFQDADLAEAAGVGNLQGGALAGFYSVLGFLIVFRSQQAYSRWWEGGSLLQQMRGEWFNAFSSCLAFCNNAPDKKREVEEFQHLLVRLTSMLYGAALSDVSELSDTSMEFFDLHGLSEDSLAFLSESHFKSEVVLQWIQRLIHEASGADVIKVAPPILSRVYNQLGNGIVLLNNAQKLNEFPVPFPVSQMIVFMLLLHWILTAMFVASTVSSPYWAFTEAFVVVIIFWSVHYIAEELEQPFGDDPNDLPISDMQADMNRSLQGLMSAKAREVPKFRYNPEKHTDLVKRFVSLDYYLTDVKRQHTLDLQALEEAAALAPVQNDWARDEAAADKGADKESAANDRTDEQSLPSLPAKLSVHSTGLKYEVEPTCEPPLQPHNAKPPLDTGPHGSSWTTVSPSIAVSVELGPSVERRAPSGRSERSERSLLSAAAAGTAASRRPSGSRPPQMVCCPAPGVVGSRLMSGSGCLGY